VCAGGGAHSTTRGTLCRNHAQQECTHHTRATHGAPHPAGEGRQGPGYGQAAAGVQAGACGAHDAAFHAVPGVAVLHAAASADLGRGMT